MFMFGSFLEQAMKVLFAIPRPWVIDPTFEPVPSAIPEATGFSFPSGHTLTAGVSLGGLALYLKKAWAFAAATVLTLLVAFSRMYLGVHTLMDVGVGFILAVFVLLLFWLIFLKNENSPRVLNTVLIVSVTLCIGLLVYLTVSPASVDPNGEGVKNAYVLVGAAIGMLLGKLIDDSVVHFDTNGTWWQQLIKVALGFVLILGLRFGLKQLFGGGSETAILRGVRYFAMSFVGVGLYPMLFKVIAKDPAKNA
jgi:undecaprenyl-diphosphatase